MGRSSPLRGAYVHLYASVTCFATMSRAPCLGYANRVYVHRFTSASIGSRLVGILDEGNTFFDYTADFFVTVASLATNASSASLTFNYCARQPAAVSPLQPVLIVPVTVGGVGYTQVCVVFSAALHGRVCDPMCIFWFVFRRHRSFPSFE